MTTTERRPALASLTPLDGEDDGPARVPRLPRVLPAPGPFMSPAPLPPPDPGAEASSRKVPGPLTTPTPIAGLRPELAPAPLPPALPAARRHAAESSAASRPDAAGDGTADENRPASLEPIPEVATARPKRQARDRSGARTRLAAGGRVSADVLIVFSRQLASFLEAGIPVLEALEVVGAETTSERMRAVAADMRDTVMRGGSFSDATARHPAVFPGWYRAMVRSAEFTGRLDDVLEQLAVYLERDQQARRHVKSALTYPTFVLIVATAGVILMSIFVLPKFAAMYDKLGATLPLPTRILLHWTNFVSGAWPFIAGTVVSLAVSWKLAFRSERGKRRRDRLAMRTPIVGSIYHLVCVERFCRVLAALTAAGVPLPDGIEMSADSTNNTMFQDGLTGVREALMRGEGLSRPLTAVELIPTAGMQMIRVGERTGRLAVQLAKAAAFFEREVAFKLKRATDLFQPAVIVIVGLLIGFVAIAQVAALYSVFGQVNP